MNLYLPIILFVSYFTLITAKDLTKKKLSDGKKIFISKAELSWFQALDFCTERNLTLLTIKSARENDEVTKAVRAEVNLPDTKKSHIWLGGIRYNQDKDFRWISDGTAVKETVYSNWFSGEPNNGYYLNEFCMELYFKTPAGQWNDDICTAKHHFICQKKK